MIKVVKDKEWVTKCVNEARKAHPSVADSAVARILELMKGKVFDRQLSQVELQELSKALLADIVPQASTKTGVADADCTE